MQAKASPENSSRSLNPNTSLVAGGHVQEQHYMGEATGPISLDRTEKRPLRTALTYKIKKQLEPFQYTNLPTSRSIRLLEILPCAGGRVRCYMRTVTLDDEPYFNALSYTWGDPLWRGLSPPAPEYETCSHEIECDGHSLKIHKNLHDLLLQLSKKLTAIVTDFKDKNQDHKVMIMLQSLRKLGAAMCHTRYWEANYIWIDAICINQQDPIERGAQVSIMGDVYRAAHSVVVWLGPHDKQADEAIRVCHILESIPLEKWQDIRSIRDENSYRKLGIPCISQEQWEDFGAFAQRSWFSRAWILQEAVLARQFVVLYDRHELPWRDLAASFGFILASKWEIEIAHLASSAAGLQNNEKFSPHLMTGNCTKVARIQALRKSGLRVSFWSLLTTVRNCMAQDPRDLVYAVLGMVHTPTNTIVPNYTKSTSEVYTEAAWAIIDETENLQLLCFVTDISKRKINDLPSWVPDWSARLRPSPLRGGPQGYANREKESRWYPAGDHRWIRPRGNFGSRELTVSALQVDTVLATATDPADAHNLHMTLELAADHLQCAPQGLSSVGRSEALWRTLIADTVHQERAVERHRDMFHDWLIHTMWKIYHAVSISDSLKLRERIEKARLSLAKLATLDDTGLVPDLGTIDADLQVIKDGSRHTHKRIIYNSTQYTLNMQPACLRRKLFRTSNGLLGLGPESLRVGDKVVIATGSDLPLILRPMAGKPQTFQFVGQAYVHEIMHGEALRLLFETKASFEDIVLI
ncbi:hypothetical protein MMC22_008679 [Lobaria immixta]|nr:hypothetical protein [Lobaria immixta]